MTAKAFEPVEFYNATFPNQLLIGRSAESDDRAKDPTVKFLAGYFRATEPWQVEMIERGCVDESGIPYAHRADSPEQTCPKCGWVCRSTKAFTYHIQQHA